MNTDTHHARVGGQGPQPAEPRVSGGRMSWAEARQQHLTGLTCLWQDLDGLHLEPAPIEPPLASHLWGWTPDGAMVRVRLDGDVAHVARCDTTAEATTVISWEPRDGRIRSFRPAPSGQGALGLELEQVVIDGITDGAGPITFLRGRAHDEIEAGPPEGRQR